MKVNVIGLTAAFLLGCTASAYADCLGESDYRVCTDSYSGKNGDQHVRSYDTEGITIRLTPKLFAFRTEAKRSPVAIAKETPTPFAPGQTAPELIPWTLKATNAPSRHQVR